MLMATCERALRDTSTNSDSAAKHSGTLGEPSIPCIFKFVSAASIYLHDCRVAAMDVSGEQVINGTSEDTGLMRMFFKKISPLGRKVAVYKCPGRTRAPVLRWGGRPRF